MVSKLGNGEDGNGLHRGSTGGAESLPWGELLASTNVTRAQGAFQPEALLECRGCSSRLMYPTGCEEHDEGRWYVELTCPDCGIARTRVFDAGMLDALDRELDQAESDMRADLERLGAANMADYVSRFVSALNADAIHPIDFTV